MVLMAAVGAVSLAEGPSTPIDVQVIELPLAAGPPPETCSEMLSQLPPAARHTPTPVPSTASGPFRPDVDGMQVIAATRSQLAALPGGRPEELAVQPLEGSKEALGRIAAVLERAARGERVRWSVFGASHTEADWWTGRLREIVQERWGDGGHGFVMPAEVVRGYRASDVRLCRSPLWQGDSAFRTISGGAEALGFAGMSVASSDRWQLGWVETTADGLGSKVGIVELFTLGQHDGGTLEVTVDGLPPIAVDTAATTGLQRTRIMMPDGPHRVAVSPAGDGPVRVLGMSLERAPERGGVIVDAIGVRGSTVGSWLDRDPELSREGLQALAPDLVTLAYGTNEASHRSYDMDAYRRDLRAALRHLREALPHAACVLVGPSDRAVKIGSGRYAVWDRTAAVAQVQREVAPELGCTFWDWQEATGGPGSMVAWRLHRPQLAAGDLIHHTRAGYERVAEMLVEALDEIGGAAGQTGIMEANGGSHE
jgi:lysophospholipase L1-like esterase